jgi:hypothetical protein
MQQLISRVDAELSRILGDLPRLLQKESSSLTNTPPIVNPFGGNSLPRTTSFPSDPSRIANHGFANATSNHGRDNPFPHTAAHSFTGSFPPAHAFKVVSAFASTDPNTQIPSTSNNFPRETPFKSTINSSGFSFVGGMSANHVNNQSDIKSTINSSGFSFVGGMSANHVNNQSGNTATIKAQTPINAKPLSHNPSDWLVYSLPMTDEEIRYAFQAQNFEIGRIPDVPPN